MRNDRMVIHSYNVDSNASFDIPISFNERRESNSFKNKNINEAKSSRNQSKKAHELNVCCRCSMFNMKFILAVSIFEELKRNDEECTNEQEKNAESIHIYESDEALLVNEGGY